MGWVQHRLSKPRAIDMQSEEIKLINLIRVILQGGWIITNEILTEFLTLSGVEHC